MVIDISGDGKDSRDYDYDKLPDSIKGGGKDSLSREMTKGSGIKQYVEQAERLGITINGLPIINPHELLDQDVVEYYEQNVITSDGFVVQSKGFEEIETAVRRKFQSEISSIIPTEKDKNNAG